MYVAGWSYSICVRKHTRDRVQVRVKYLEWGIYVIYKDHEDAQRPRALYHINPDFRGI